MVNRTFLCTLSFLKISVASSRCWFSKILSRSACVPHNVDWSRGVLLSVPGQQRQIQDQGDPVSIDEEQESQEGVDSGFGDDVCVEAVAEIDGVDVVAGVKLACASWDTGRRRNVLCTEPRASSPFQIAIHNSEEDLEEQVDGIYQHRQQVQPRFASHCGGIVCCVAPLS
jgi:hypothetical protein